MAWRIRYSVNVDWVGPGEGAMTGSTAALPLGGGSQQTLNFQQSGFGSIVPGSTAGPPVAMTGADITTLTNAMAADMSTQMNAQLARLNGFATGGT